MLKIRSELSKKNPYWISKNRYYELKYFCLQYNEWKTLYRELSTNGISTKTRDEFYDPTGDIASILVKIKYKLDLIDSAAYDTDSELYEYILNSVTNNVSYNTLRMIYEIPCGRDYFYERYHKFFYLLNFRKRL